MSSPLGFVIPCRNEAGVLPRKLANLAAAEWPESGRPHLIVVVDDGSTDDTIEVATRCAVVREDVVTRVIGNDGTPGKVGAIAAGLADLEGEVDVVVLTDADVVIRPEAPRALAAAFESEPGLAMGSGTQHFVEDLAQDGRCLSADGGPLRGAGGLYDRWTAGVRALESRSGRLFSVHGQLLAWRTELGLRPTPGIAADDLDLMLQARRAGGAVRLVPEARFFEVKLPPGPGRRAQALRRARAYFQVLEIALAGRTRIDGAQLFLYRTLPGLTPWLVGLVLAGTLLALWLAADLPGLILGVSLLVLALLHPLVRRLFGLMAVISYAWWTQRRGSISDRWEVQRS